MSSSERRGGGPTLALPVYYDFSSTICFVADRVLAAMRPELEALGVTVEWRPVDLAAITGWRRDEPTDGARRENALRVARELGVAVRVPTSWIDSRPAGAVALGLAGTAKEPAWRERVWSAVFEEGRDVAEPATLEAIARDVGLDLVRMPLEPLLARLAEATSAAVAAEVSGVPTFDVDFPLGGIQQPETMRLLIERWAANRRRREKGSDPGSE